MSCTLYPALDIREGRVVRLHQGDYQRETRYELDPVEQAARYAHVGAQWLHLVDLDAARAGGYTLAPLLQAIKARTELKIQTGGGVREQADVERILRAGADRVVVGSLAVREPERVLGWLRAFGGERVTVALDARQDAQGEWRLPTAGWTEQDGQRLEDLLARYAEAGLKHLLCTDIDRDGTLAGPNLALYRRILAFAPRVALQASGGVRDIDDIEASREVGCAGVVLGKALLEGRFELGAAFGRMREAAC